MTDFSQIYKRCIGSIVNDMRRMGKFGEGEEYVNDGYVNLIASGKEVNFNNLYFYSRQSLNKGEVFLIEKQTGLTNETTKTCKRCGQNKPIGYFGITENNSLGQKTIQPYCRDCAKKYFKEYVGKNKKQWNDKEKQRYKKESSELSNAYIKKYLRNYGWQTSKITSNTISFTRKHILKIRIIKSSGGKVPPGMKLSKILKAD